MSPAVAVATTGKPALPDELAPGGDKPDTAAAAAPITAESTTPPEAAAEGAASEAAPSEDAVAAAKQAASAAGKQLSEAQKAERAARFRDMDRKRHDAERRADRAEARARDLEAKLQKPDPATFTDVGELNAAQVEHTLGKRDAARLTEEAKTAAQEADVAAREAWQERASVFKETATDFEEVAYKAPLSDAASADILRMEDGPQLAYYLGKNPAEARALNALSERERAIALGRLSGKLAASPPRRVTQAPAPISSAVTGRSAPASNWAKMGHDEYAAALREEMKARR